MVTVEAQPRPTPRGLSVHVRGHLLLFDKKSASACDASAGARLLFIAVVLEAVRLVLVRWLHPLVPLVLLVPLQLGFALLSVRFVAGLRLSQIGFHGLGNSYIVGSLGPVG